MRKAIIALWDTSLGPVELCGPQDFASGFFDVFFTDNVVVIKDASHYPLIPRPTFPSSCSCFDSEAVQLLQKMLKGKIQSARARYCAVPTDEFVRQGTRGLTECKCF